MTSRASHASSLEFYYFWVSDSTYNFTMIFYRNCQGFTATPPSSVQIQVSSAQLAQTFYSTLPMMSISGAAVPPKKPPQLLNCNSQSQCYEEYVYRANIVMPKKARDWVFTYDLCCIPTEFDNVLTTNTMYALAGMNNKDFPDSLAKNFSPVWHTRRPNIPGHIGDTLINYPIRTTCEYRK